MTQSRSITQGICFAVVRISLGAFSFFVPLLTTTGFTNLALILTGFLVVSSMSEARQACRPDARG